MRPTLFTNIRNDMTIAREEIFGPVLWIIPCAEDEEANPNLTFKGREFSAQSRLFHAKDIGGTGVAAEI